MLAIMKNMLSWLGRKLVSTMGLEALIFLNNESSKKIDILYLSVVDIWYLVGLETADYLWR